MCEYSSDAYGYCEAWRSITRTARKQHTCTACSWCIVAGDKYRYVSGIFEGEPFSYKVCPACDVTLDEFKSRHNDSPLIDELESVLEYCIREDGADSWAAPYLAQFIQRRDAARSAKESRQ